MFCVGLTYIKNKNNFLAQIAEKTSAIFSERVLPQPNRFGENILFLFWISSLFQILCYLLYKSIHIPEYLHMLPCLSQTNAIVSLSSSRKKSAHANRKAFAHEQKV